MMWLVFFVRHRFVATRLAMTKQKEKKPVPVLQIFSLHVYKSGIFIR
jgi:hypothetical protein